MEQKVVLVTGASRGIGRAIALTFAENGYDVIINCLKSADALASLERQICPWASAANPLSAMSEVLPLWS